MTDANQHGAEPTSPRWTLLPVSLWSPTTICSRPKKPIAKFEGVFHNLDQHEGERIMIRQRGAVTMNLPQGGNSSQNEVPMQVQGAGSKNPGILVCREDESDHVHAEETRGGNPPQLTLTTASWQQWTLTKEQ